MVLVPSSIIQSSACCVTFCYSKSHAEYDKNITFKLTRFLLQKYTASMEYILYCITLGIHYHKCQDYTLINQYKILTEKNGPVQ